MADMQTETEIEKIIYKWNESRYYRLIVTTTDTHCLISNGKKTLYIPTTTQVQDHKLRLTFDSVFDGVRPL